MYDPSKIEPKWQKYWSDNQTFKTEISDTKEKYYVLDMFPYPSGSGLHVGHPEGYTATDIISRYKRMMGYNVLHPMGWDAFGLPAENYAIKTKIHPKETTKNCINVFKPQIQSIGFSYDWDREISTSSPEYYKWTQWFFLFLYKNGLAYKKKAPVNWCETCKTVLANEQVIEGKCERCKDEVEQKKLNQWFFKITDFIEDSELNGRKTDGLLTGLGKIDWPESTKLSQSNWIGKSFGSEVDFEIEGHDENLTVYTTRIDTIFSGTFMVLAPEHSLIAKLTTEENKSNVEKYIKETAKKNNLERTELSEGKTGVFTGSYAINPATGDKMPIWIAEFVIASYGSGAVFADAHDERDFVMAKTFDIPLKVSIRPKDDELWAKVQKFEECFSDEGVLVNSGQFNGLTSKEARDKITNWLAEKGSARKTIKYKLRDWLVSRQRYWGAPIPIIHCNDCGEVPVPEEDLPITLPDDVDFVPTGESPLHSSKSFQNVSCPKCNKPAKREADTMDTFVCSSWYMFRFADPKNEGEFTSAEALKNWCPVDLYVGGAEHTVLHLLYSRFFTKVLHRYGYTEFDEPFMKLRHQGMILGEDGEKMSKSRGNVINPDDVIKMYGADTLRIYEMFMGPFDAMKPWSTQSIEGGFRFLQKVWRLVEEKELIDKEPSDDINRLLHKTIKKVTEDIEEFRFNTAISQMMIFANELLKKKIIPKSVMGKLALIISPFAPHLGEEIWEYIGNSGTLAFEAWPMYNPELVIDSTFELVFSVNGKVRGKKEVPMDISKEDAISAAYNNEDIKRHTDGKEIIKEIYVPNKLVNIVVR